ncbi:hypothetical protein KL905_002931 [Ogataea polymorpha]|uniref:Phosphatidylethanolamine-binding protein n=2 Tax=Ogataea polymorpha TaxID=460523 RepID=A0A9P8SY71_9ASCO|nr:hypothetical protein KL907_003112 [Ogataea polymorpha]KAG7907983.1 hypothetical protein KL906_003400 [Ogataea polymorpha]KAG7916566.1 hypothetical protein KL927_003205 [Ogataea polymorpha]KAG7921473.1 hypothetical protein KL905_002931 [Ogataea polymorpha]KAG7933965.1 hypothetical protein KL934_002887 [Ogataea polymorpha]
MASQLKLGQLINRSTKLVSLRYSSYLAPRPTLSYRPALCRPIINNKMGLVTISNSIKDALTKSEVVPTVIHSDSFTPKGFLIISYGQDKEVAMGNTLLVKDTQRRPDMAFTLNLSKDTDPDFSISSSDRFTLVLTDPDAPTKGDEKWSEYCHYVVKNIKLNDFDPNKSVDISQIEEQLTTSNLNGEDLIPYMGPAPPPKTGKHRYVFLLYKQKPGVEPEAPADRPCWGTGVPGWGAEEWSQKNELQLLAVNFFYAQNEEQ